MTTKNIASIFAGGFVPASVMEEVVSDPEAVFIKTIADYGLDADHLIYDEIVRVKTAGDKGGEKSGWYIYYPGGIPAGAYGDWRNGGEAITWCAKRQEEMSPAEWMENKRRMEQAKKHRMEQLQAEHKRAAAVAKDIVSESQLATDDHPYLVAKRVKSHGLRIHAGNLVIPAINEQGEVTTIQTIDGAGEKRFMKGGKKSGSFFWIEGSRNTIYLCEGYATGATINEVTGCAVVVAFDAGNLPKVAAIIREKFLSAHIVVAADNDQYKDNGNAGVKCAKQAADAIRANVVIPQFIDTKSKPTDFNDLAALEGIDRVREQLVGKPSIDSPKKRFELSRVDSLEISEINWVVSGFLEQDSFNLIFGEPGCGKSFIAIDMACCVATGTAWHGHKVDPGLVIYIAGEGHNGLARRFKAWEKESCISLKDAPLYKSHRSTQLYDMQAALEVAEAVNAIAEAEGKPVRMIIADTVARNMGGDENSTQDMNLFIEHIDALLRHPHKAAIVLVHHSGKASPGQARGSTALRGALDAEYMVEMNPTSRMILFSNKKMKDGEIPPEINFSIKKVGLDVYASDGTEITGAVLETADISGLVNQAAEKRDALTKNQRKAMIAFESLVFARDRDGVASPITIDDWREAAHEQGLDRSRFREAKNALEAKKVVRVNAAGVVSVDSGVEE